MTVLRTSVLAVLILVPGGVAAQEQSGLARALELPAHRALIEITEGATPGRFETDGCSGGMSTLWRGLAGQFPDLAAVHGNRPPWESCCEAHDRIYHVAGRARDADQSYEARLAADEALNACVVQSAEPDLPRLTLAYDLSETRLRQIYAAIGDAMFLAVRLGGGPCSGLPWRWGYGYPDCLTLFPTPDAAHDTAADR